MKLTVALAELLREASSVRPDDGTNLCMAPDGDGFFCTVTKGHTGCHIAHGGGTDINIHAVWKDEVEG